jgi:flagellar biosynthesis GTPase FlhF
MDKKQISKTRALAVSTIDIITNIKRHFLSVIFIMMRKTLTGLVLTALFTTTCADVVHAGRKNHWGQDNGTYIQMKRMDQDGRYNPQNLEKVQTELRFVQSNPECCHRAFSGNVGRVAKTILCLAAVGIVAGGSYGLVQALKSQDSSPSDDPFMGRNETHTSGTDLATTASPPLFTAAPTTLNPLQGQLSEALRANGQFRSELTGLRSENRRFQNSLEKFRKQLEANNKFHGRQRVQKEEQLLAKISELEAKQKASDEKIRSTEQRLQSSENRVRELERQRQQQEARQRAENERQPSPQEACLEKVFQDNFGTQDPQGMGGWVDVRSNVQPQQYADLCRDPVERRVVECLGGSCDADRADPQTDPIDACLKNVERTHQKPAGTYASYNGVQNLPQSQQNDYCNGGDPAFSEVLDCLGVQCPKESGDNVQIVLLNPSEQPNVAPYPVQSAGGSLDPTFHLDDYAARYPSIFQEVDRFFEERVLGHQDRADVKLALNVRTHRNLGARANTIVTGYTGDGVPSTATINIDARTLGARDADVVVKHEVFHDLMFDMYVNKKFLDTRTFGVDQPLFRGPKAVAAYRRMTGQEELGIPLTHDYHLDPRFFRGEVNVICGLARGNSWSDVAMAMLEDMGWNVRSDLADPLPEVRSFAQHVKNKVDRGFIFPGHRATKGAF